MSSRISQVTVIHHRSRTQSLESPSGRHSCEWPSQLLKKGFTDIYVLMTICIDRTRRTLVIDFPCYTLEIATVLLLLLYIVSDARGYNKTHYKNMKMRMQC